MTGTAPGILLVGNHFYPNIGGELSRKLQDCGWRVVETSRLKNAALRLGDMLLTAFTRRRSYDIAQVDVFSGRAFVWAESVCWLLRRVGKPYVLTLHGGNLPAFAKTARRRVECLLRSAGAVTTPSGYLKEAFQDVRQDITLVPNPINQADYTRRIRRLVQPRLVWVRAFHKVYNPTLAVRVLAQLAESFPEVRLEMVGPDKLDGSLAEVRTSAAALGVEKNLNLVGPVSKRDVPGWLNRSDIFLNTTDVDNTPVTVLEALASGLCIVSTDAGGLPFLLRNGHDAVLVPRNDPAAMAGAVRSILESDGLGERLSRHALETAREFDWAVVLPQWQALLEKVLGGGGASRTC